MTSIARRVLAAVLTSFALLCATAVDAQHLGGGTRHSLFLTSSGTVWAVGSNAYGQLGDNTWTVRKVPVPVSGLTNVVAVAAGAWHSLALKSDGTVWAWGYNYYGALGDGSTTDRKVPVQVGVVSNVVAIAAGEYHSLAVTSSGQVYAWGYGAYGQLGTGSTGNASLPSLIMSSGGASVGAGFSHTLVVKTDGTVWAAGYNNSGQLGNGNTTQQTSLVQMTGITSAVRAAGGSGFSVVLLSDGTARATGYNAYGQLGDNTNTYRTTAVAVQGLTGATEIAAGAAHTVARTDTGAVYAWGYNSGLLGDGTTTHRKVATVLSTLSGIDHVGAGHYSGFGATGGGTIWAWGDNDYYQLGDGSTTDRTLPNTISGAGYSWNVTTPVLSVGTGTYYDDRNVVVTVDTPGATIHYTRTGAEPTESDPVVASGGTLTVTETQTLKAKAWKPGSPASTTASATYTMEVSTPYFSPSGSTFTSPTTVTITSSTAGVSFRYTVDGTDPTPTSTLYAGPIAIGTTTVLKAIGTRANWTTSPPRWGTYTMNFGTLPAPTISQPPGTYEGQVSVALSSSVSGAIVRYTTDGSTPTASSTAYTAPVVVTTTSTLKAKAFRVDYTTSTEASATYTIKVPAPQLSLAPGSYQPGAQVTITSPDSAATLRVTFTGTNPTSTDGSVPSGTTLLVGSFTMKVRATRAGCVDSDVTTATYTLTEPLSAGALTVGGDHNAFATPQGLLYAWGRNTSGQVGDGSNTNRKSPVAIPAVTGVVALAAGDFHTLALTWDGRVFAWGYNDSGRLGDGTTTDRNVPVLVPGLSSVVAIAAGASHNLALTADGVVYSWGVGTSGQLGHGSTVSQQVPTLITSLTGVVGIAAGDVHSLALTSSGQAYAWGANSYGQLGDGTTTAKSSPVLVSALTQVANIRAGGSHSLARLQSGAVYAWGYGAQGQLGLGTTSNVSTPTAISGLGVVDLDAADWHSLAIANDGTLRAWGDNNDGKLGDGVTTDRLTPITLATPTSVAFVAGGEAHSVAITTDGHVWTWGGNSYGQLGDGTTTGQLTPHDVVTVAGVWGATPAPILSLAPGTYNAPQAVVATAGAGVTMHYTTTGVVPTEADAVLASGAIVEIDRTLTLSVKAWSGGRTPSAPVVAAYQLQPPAPTVNVPAGVYNSAQTVSLQGAAGVDIRYTLDGTDPSETSTLYASPVTISQTATLRARAFKPNWTPSTVLVAAYQIVVPTTTISIATPTNGTSVDPPATIDIQASVTSTVPVTVTFFEGTTAIDTITGAPYRVSWPAPGPGVYTLTATATDGSSNITTSSPVTITVRTLPAISNVSPGTGAAGTLVTITGTDFGATQGSSSLWLGTKVGTIETWADGLITARIASGASSGTVQVRLADRSSNAVPITVLTPVISNATPGSGGIGATVTVSGSNFGAGQGTGQLWLGTAAGVVTSWSDTQIVATIAAGSQTGTVQVLQNGVASNSVPLTITGAAPRITWLTPTQGGAGTVVTLSGSGFGSAQGSGAVQLGSGLAGVVSWSNSQVQVSVPTGAVSGVVKLQQGGLWSNAVAFRVPAPAGSAAVLSPSALSLVVGEMRSLQALDDDGELVTGATWTSSDANVVSLSTADPPVLTAVAPGTATITVGGASSEVTVYSGPSLPLGTVIWTNGASTAGGLYPAVPNYDAVADVFARGADDEVTAITADGSTAWVRPGFSIRELYPDFQGGVVVEDDDKSLWRLHPLTGEPLHLFSYTSPEAQSYGQGTPRIHPDGTVFVTDYACTSADCYDGTDSETGAWVVGINSATGATKFRVKLQNSTDFTDTTPADELFCQFTGGTITQHAWVDYPWSAIIAGDGFYYLPYRRYQATGSRHRSAAQVYSDAVYDLWDQLGEQVVNSQFAAALATHAALVAARGDSYNGWDSQLDGALNNGVAGRTAALNLLNLHYKKYWRLCDSAYTWTEQLRVMRVASDGAFTDIGVKSWETNHSSTYNLVPPSQLTPWGYRESVTHAGVDYATVYDLSLVTDRAEGILMSWLSAENCPGEYAPEVLVLTNTCAPATDEHLTLLTNGAIASDVVWGHDLFRSMRLELQREDGTFVGSRYGGGGYATQVFDASGAIRSELAGYFPESATAAGGVIATSSSSGEAVEFDSNNAVVRQVNDVSLTRSWMTLAYRGSNSLLELVVAEDVSWANSFAAVGIGKLQPYGTNVALFQTQSGVPGTSLTSGGGTCTLGNAQPPLQGAALAVYASARNSLKAWPTLSAPGFKSAACSAAIKPPYFADVEAAIDRQQPFDGPATTISQYAAGYFTPTAMSSPAAMSALQRNLVAPMCSVFIPRAAGPGKWEVASAAAQAANLGTPEAPSPAKNVYVNTNPSALQQFTEGSVLHEALHNLTGFTDQGSGFSAPGGDMGLPAYLGPPTQGGKNPITQRLVEAGCAPR